MYPVLSLSDTWAAMLDALANSGFALNYLFRFLLHPRTIIPALIIGILARHPARAIIYSVAVTASLAVIELLFNVAQIPNVPATMALLIRLEDTTVATILDTALWTAIVYAIASARRRRRKRIFEV